MGIEILQETSFTNSNSDPPGSAFIWVSGSTYGIFKSSFANNVLDLDPVDP
jgi:hypothetical protein